MTIPYLAALKPTHGFKLPDVAGQWQSTAGTMAELADAIRIDEQASCDPVRATPDQWAQLRSFAAAIVGPAADDPAVGQWRALLALFALADWHKTTYQLHLTPLDLRKSTSHFARVMRELVPGLALPLPADGDGKQLRWEAPVIVSLVHGDDARPIAVMNPGCLVAPGRGIADFAVPSLPWLGHAKGGALADPLTAPPTCQPSPVELAIIADYLKRLEARLQAENKKRSVLSDPLTSVCARLIKYREDCRAALGTQGAKPDEFACEAGPAANDGLAIAYQWLATPSKIVDPGGVRSACIIAPRMKGNGPLNGFVLLDPALANEKRPARLIPFWGLNYLSDMLTATAEKRAEVAADMAAKGYLLVTPEDLFSPVMVRLNASGRQGEIAGNPPGFRATPLPVSPLLLLIIPAAELATRLTEPAPGVVSLQLLVAGQSHNLNRRYRVHPEAGEGRLLEQIDPGANDMAVWPDFVSPAWQLYFARFGYNPRTINRLRGRCAINGPMLAAQLAAIADPVQRCAAALAWTKAPTTAEPEQVASLSSVWADRPGFTRLRQEAAATTTEINRCSDPIEAIATTVIMATDTSPVPAGLLLLALTPHERPGEADTDVAVDFGTTNTVACLSSNDPVVFQNRVVRPVRLANQGAGMAALDAGQQSFFPEEQRPLPTPSVLIDAKLDNEARLALKPFNTPKVDPESLFRQLIYFQPDYQPDTMSSAADEIKLWQKLIDRLKFNLKWETPDEKRAEMRRYLRQIIMMIAAEHAGDGNDPSRLIWHFSRPGGMGDDADFRSILSASLKSVIKGFDESRLPDLTEEGQAVADYVLTTDAKTPGVVRKINVVLDIGGGTTDIAIWKGGETPEKLCEPVSLRIAGGDFFTGHIVENPGVLAQLGLGKWQDLVASISGTNDIKAARTARHVCELLFSGTTLAQAIEENWAMVSGTEAVRRLRETAMVYLGAVAWMVGWQLRQKIKAGVVDAADLESISVSLCGRGAGLFVRLHGIVPTADTAVSRLFQLIVVSAGGKPSTLPHVRVSPTPKIEVAAGMIRSARLRGPATKVVPKPTSTDVFEEPEAPVMQAAEPSVPKLKPPPYPNIAGDELERFLKMFAIAAKLQISLSENQWEKLHDMADQKTKEDVADGRDGQSRFAYLAKALVELMTQTGGMRPTVSQVAK